jgi:predicted RNA-binding Zn-ribbon protein involved in translation (DUF1610 family)
MAKNLRFSEKWFRRLLWVIAILFAWFLIGLGGTVIRDLPKVDRQTQTVEDVMDKNSLAQQKARLQEISDKLNLAKQSLEGAELQAQSSRNRVISEEQALNQWLRTRSVIKNQQEDTALMDRNRRLEQLRETLKKDTIEAERLRKEKLSLSQGKEKLSLELQKSKQDAQETFNKVIAKEELKVFLYRLVLTLPLMALAIFLFKKHRHGKSWPFVWGFIIFSLFTFFFELVPYLPSYGGYVRYIIGILITILGGRHLINALQKYLDQQKEKEEMSQEEKREHLDRDIALDRFSKSVCPTCERSVDTKDPAIDFCSHCGFSLFKKCKHCGTRHNSLELFCHSCGKKHES